MICTIHRKTWHFQYVPPSKPISIKSVNGKQPDTNRSFNEIHPNGQSTQPPRTKYPEVNEKDIVHSNEYVSISKTGKEAIPISDHTEILTGPQFQQLFREPSKNLLGEIFPCAGIGVIVAESDIGKSTLVRQILLAIALGKSEVIGMPIHAENGKSICISTEEAKIDIWESVMDQLSGFNQKELPSNIRFMIKPDSTLNSLELALENENADIVVIDTIYNLVKGNFSLPNVVEPILNRISSIAEKFGCFILLVVHSAKGKSLNDPHKDNVMGSRIIEANARVVIELKRDSENNRKIHLCVVKGNRIKNPETKSKSFVLKIDEHRLFQPTGERVPFDKINRKNAPVEDLLLENQPESSRLTPEQRLEIVQELKNGEKQTVLAKKFGVTQGAISQLLKKHNAA